MPSWAIHLKVAQALSKKIENKNKDSFILGNILPDVNVGYLIQPISKEIQYSVTHYGRRQTFEGKTRELPDYKEFIKDYSLDIENPIVLGYLTHLLTDFYWNYNTYIEKGIYENDNMVAIKNGKNVVYGDKETLRKIKVNNFNSFSIYLYQNNLVEIPNFQKDLWKETRIIKQIHIEESDLIGVNQYFANIYEKIKNEEQEYKIYSLEDMKEGVKNNIEFIEETLKTIE